MCCGQEDKSWCFFPAHSESRGETPAPNCTKHNHMLLFPHTRALNPPICFPPNAQPPEPLSLHLFDKKTKQNIAPHLWECACLGLLSRFVSACFYSFIYWPSFATLTILLSSIQRCERGVCVKKKKEKLSRDTTLNSMFLSLTIRLF